ncbi:MAG: hypothetical protein OQJ81_06575, partial [Melioribacteraceae bacterium]|nr:hypothetical protein [Melioribacteraceae bacterium]
ETVISDFTNIQHKNIKFDEIMNLSNREFRDKFEDSPILRAKSKGLKRNAEFLKKSLKLNDN